MSNLPTLSPKQFERVSSTFGAIVGEGLSREAAEAHIGEHCADDEIVAATLRDMLEAHETETASEDTSGAFHKSALDAVLEETKRAGDEIDQHVPERIGPYRIVRYVASGGMGTVYEGEQDEPRRRVAIKVIRLELLTPEAIRRFEDEGHLLARLRHPGIARVFAMGRTETPAGAVPYLVLEFIDGVPITQFAKEQRLDTPGRIALLRRVCEAVQYAHDNGVMHRDLKPGNVLVDASGQPHVLDFGIGRTFDDERNHASLTASGLFLGTLAYMSPEQAVRTGKPLDVRVDVYGVGAIGYELLAGRPPQEVRDLPLHRAIEQVAQREASSLDSVDAAYAGDLTAIFGKALATDPKRRYLSVRDLDDDLRRHLEHEAVRARPPSRFYQARRMVKRHRTTFALLTLLVVSLIAGLIVSLSQRFAALDAKADALASAGEAEKDRRAAMLASAWGAVEEGRVLELDHALAPFEAEAQTYIEHALLHAHTRNATRVRKIEGLPEGARIAVSTDGRRGFTLGAEGQLLLVDLETARAHPVLGEVRFPAHSGTWSSGNPDRIVLATPERVTVVDAGTESVVREIDAASPTVALDAKAQDLYLWKSAPHLVDLESGSRIDDPALTEDLGESKLVDGHLLVHRQRAFDLRTRQTRVVRSHFRAALRSPDGRYSVLSGYRPNLHDAERDEIWSLDVHQGIGSSAFAFSEDSKQLAVLYWDGSVQLWDLESRAMVRALWDLRVTRAWKGSQNPAGRSVRFLPGGRLRTVTRELVVDWTIDPPPTRLDHAASVAPFRFVYQVAWHPGGRFLASAGWDGTLAIWDAHAGRELGRFAVADVVGSELMKKSNGVVIPTNLLWSAEGDRLYLRLDGGMFAIFDVWSRDVVTSGSSSATVLAIDRDGVVIDDPKTRRSRRVTVDAMAAESGSAVPFDGPFPPWAREEGLTTGLRGFSRAGDRAARLTEARDAGWHGIGVWDFETDQESVLDVSGGALTVCLTDDGARAVAGTRSGTLQLFDVETRRRLMVLHGHDDYVIAIAPCPDGSMLASGSGDGYVRIWPLLPMAERVARAEAAAAQAARLASLVDRAMKATEDGASRRDALLADPNLDEADRDAALALLFDRLDD